MGATLGGGVKVPGDQKDQKEIFVTEGIYNYMKEKRKDNQSQAPPRLNSIPQRFDLKDPSHQLFYKK